MRTNLARSLAVLGLLLAGGHAAADLPVESGEKLVETTADVTQRHRLACGSQFCVWHLSDYLGGCSEEDCNSHYLVVSDREGKALGAITAFAPVSTVRFLSPRQLEAVSPSNLIFHHPGGSPWDPGIDATLMRRRLLTFSPDGARVVTDSQAWCAPERHKKLERLLARPPLGEETSPPKTPVAADVLAKAKADCSSEAPLEVMVHECHKGSCLLMLSGKSEDSGQSLCAFEVKGQTARRLPIGRLVDVEEASDLENGEARGCFFSKYGGVRGGYGDEQCLSLRQPGRMAFIDTAGLHLESGQRYPVRKAGSVTAGRQLAPTVHADTAAHVSWGLDAWRSEKDLSLMWQAMRLGDTLQLHVEVVDDVVVPLEAGAAVHTDHLELDFWPPRVEHALPKALHLKLGVLLAGAGKAQVRLWKRMEKAQDRDVDEAYSASGTWARAERGYVLDVTLPLEPLRKALEARRSFQFAIKASDADEKGRQETLLGRTGSLRLWDEYPPTIEEYLHVAAGD